MKATKESKNGLAFFDGNCVVLERRKGKLYEDIWAMVRVLIDLRVEEKITEGQFRASLKYIFSNYAEAKIMEKIDHALDKTLLRQPIS